jgi:hypothetical protein
MPEMMGNLVDLADSQAASWRGVPRTAKKK